MACGCKTWPSWLTDEQWLKIFENGVMRRMGWWGKYFDQTRRKWQGAVNICLIRIFMTFAPDQMLFVFIKWRKMRGGKIVAHTRGEMHKVFFMGKPEERRPLVRPRGRWKSNIKIDLPERVSEGLTVIHLTCVGTNCWLFWTGKWIFWFNEVPELPDWLRKEYVVMLWRMPVLHGI
jgi:hypothetical protein